MGKLLRVQRKNLDTETYSGNIYFLLGIESHSCLLWFVLSNKKALINKYIKAFHLFHGGRMYIFPCDLVYKKITYLLNVLAMLVSSPKPRYVYFWACLWNFQWNTRKIIGKHESVLRTSTVTNITVPAPWVLSFC